MSKQYQKKTQSEEIGFKNAQGCQVSTVCHRSLDLDNRGNLARVRKSRWVKAKGFDGKFSEPGEASASVKFPWNLSRKQIFLTIFKTTFPSDGFTLIEILISVGIIALIGSLGLVSFIGSRRIRDLNVGTQSALAVMRLAQSKTLAAEGGEPWGVHLESDKYTLFPAQNSFSVMTASNTVYILPSTLEIANISLAGGGQDIIFQRITGKTAQSGAFELRVKSGADLALITIGASGEVSSGGDIQAPSGSRVTDTRHRNFDLGWSIKNSITLTLTFSDPPNPDIISSVVMTPVPPRSIFDWSGTVSVYGQPQTLRIHAVSLTDTNTIFSIDRSRLANNKKVKIEIDGKHIATYEAEGVLTVGQFGGTASEP